MQVSRSTMASYATSPQKPLNSSVYHQNLSGSDTDVSTSNENLTAEEKSTLRNGIRQEPQGEETVDNDADTTAMNTLIIHGNRLSGDNSMFYGQNSVRNMVQNIQKSHEVKFQGKYDRYHDGYSSPQEIQNSPCTSMNKIHNSVPSSPKCSPRKVLYSNLQSSPHILHQYQACLNQSVPHLPDSYHYGNLPLHSDHPLQDGNDMLDHYLDQSEILKHLAKEMSSQKPLPENCIYPHPPDYPKWQPSEYSKLLENSSGSCSRPEGMSFYSNSPVKMADKFPVSRSQPDLSHVGKNYHVDDGCAKMSRLIYRTDGYGRPNYNASTDCTSQASSQLIELLSTENIALKNELDMYYKKVSKLQKFELEIQKVHQSHEALVRSSDKREKLERAVRMRLEMEIRRLQEQNKELKDHLECATSHVSKRPLHEASDSELRKELSKREVLIAQLLTQNKELLAEKERQEIELQAQRATLQEQRNHIDILDSALTNAQTNVVKLEEESRKKQVYVERVAQLQKALTSLQQSSERRLQMEKKVRLQLEKEVESLRQQKGGKTESTPQKDEKDNKETLKKTVLDYEKKIIGLEAEVSKWEQRYIEESTMRQIAVDAASVPKDAKIAALEKTSQESEKLIAQARTEKLKQMDELYAANRKCTELEERIKDFESKLAEKDAMIKVLQQHSQSKDAVLQHAVLGRPPRHARAASTMGLTTSTSHTTTTTGVSCLGRSSPSPSNTLHRRTGSNGDVGASSGSLLSIASESSNTTQNSESSPVTESVTGSQKSLDEQLKELDSRLSSKDSIISALRAEKERYPSHFWRV